MGRPSRQAQHTAPDWARRLQGDRGQAWPSCALTLHGCPLTLWVGGPSRLSLTLPVPAPFFQSLCLVLIISKSLSLLLSLSYSWFQCLTLTHSVIFSTYLFVSCPSFPFLLLSSLVNSSVDMPAGEATPPFPGPCVFPSLSIPPSLTPCPVPCRGIGGISLPGSSWGRLHLSQGFPLKRHFLPLENCSLPTVTLSA